jgi:hypothetical protein
VISLSDLHPGSWGRVLCILPAAQRGVQTKRGAPTWRGIRSELRTGGQRDTARDCETQAGAAGSVAMKASKMCSSISGGIGGLASTTVTTT